MGEDLRAFIQERGLIKRQLTYFKTFLQSPDINNRIVEVKSRLSKIQSLASEFSKVQLNIELIDDSENQAIEDETFHNQYYALIAQAQEIIDNNTASYSQITVENSHTNSRSCENNIRVKLPAINLPSFSGNYNEWISFSETFESLISDNQSLDDIQRFHYLRSCLKGEPFDLTKSLSATSANYKVAWHLLKARYDNKRLIVKNHVHAICNLPVVTKNSSASLRQLINTVEINCKLLQNLEQPVDSWDLILIELITSKLDHSTVAQWESTKITGDVPTLSDFFRYLQDKCYYLESLECSTPNTKGQPQNKSKGNGPGKSVACVATNNTILCWFCKGEHLIHHCSELIKRPVNDRINQIKSVKRCLNCLRDTHTTERCPSKFKCRTCKKRHHTILHVDEQKTTSVTTREVTTPSASHTTNSVTSVNNHCQLPSSQILLSTAIVNVTDSFGNIHEIRCLLDPGSQSNFISADACKRLRLEVRPTRLPICGINRNESIVSQITDVTVTSKHEQFAITLSCLVLPAITENLPLVSFDSSWLKFPPNIALADPHFNLNGTIDMLIGAELFWQLLGDGSHDLGANQPQLRQTKLGWIVGGKINTHESVQMSSCLLSLSTIDERISKFWKIEDLPLISNAYSHDEMVCEKHFNDTYKRDDTGRYVVCLPFKSSSNAIGNSYEQSLKRFHTLERKFYNNVQLKTAYVAFMNEYKQLGHMSLIHDTNKHDGFYLPHHAVYKVSDGQSKIRVVFDGSAKSSSGVSLNDNLLVGPTIQPELFSILLRFRVHKFVFTADIKKMYRQVLIAPEDRKYQKILWRENPGDQLQTYKLNTVTYGTASAPFLAVRSLHQLAADECSEMPQIRKVICNDFYVDDLLTGGNELSSVINLKNQLISILIKGGFELDKWASNHPDLVQSSEKIITTCDIDKTTKLLGLLWDSSTDIFKYSVHHLITHTNVVTKRIVLSKISQLFDPLGLITPILIRGKILMQSLWSVKVEWDQQLPHNLLKQWEQFVVDLPQIANLTIDRRITFIDNICMQELHGFCDASESAYGACIYLRTLDQSNCTSVNLVCAKSRVSPLKSISIPRLELCGAQLLSKLINKVKQDLGISDSHCHMWTDSTIVLSWLSSNSRNWNVFVANRVSEIQTTTDIFNWHHVNSADNPADLISRGTTPGKLSINKLWWNGPPWLSFETVPLEKPYFLSDVPERRKTTCVATVITTWPVIFNFSSFPKLVRTIALCMRFVFNCRNKHLKRSGRLLPEEIYGATVQILKQVQLSEFKSDIQALQKTTRVDSHSRLASLNPFVDENNLIRVGGRIKHANVQHNAKHPWLLPSKHHFTRLIIEHFHQKLLHAGQEATLAAVRSQYWPIAGRGIVRKILQQCIRCFKTNPRATHQLMGDLPASRVQPHRPFLHTGIDFAGPIFLKQGRGRAASKAYIAVFVCFGTKAIHLELVSDLSTATFLSALKRFIARRGNIAHIYSDNATNFVGANRELQQLKQIITPSNIDLVRDTNITWHFSPPRAPHFGGLWESAVKAVKTHLKRIIGETILNFEEMYTLLSQIEAVLNSRPLSPLSNDPNDLQPLTPGHFLIGEPLTAPVEPFLQHIKINRLSRWQSIERIRQCFWKRWSTEYLSSLQQRTKWRRQHGHEVKEGTLVLIHEDNLPPLKWKLGRVIKLHPGKDNIVRVVSLKTINGEVKRPVTKLCILPIADKD